MEIGHSFYLINFKAQKDCNKAECETMKLLSDNILLVYRLAKIKMRKKF